MVSNALGVPVPGTSGIPQIVQNERIVDFFSTYPKFGHIFDKSVKKNLKLLLCTENNCVTALPEGNKNGKTALLKYTINTGRQ